MREFRATYTQKYKFSLFFLFPPGDIIINTQRYHDNYQVLLPIYAVARRVSVMPEFLDVIRVRIPILLDA
jgi:hypothetical protein